MMKNTVEIESMEQNVERAVMLLKAMANEKRLFILCHLQDKEVSVGVLSERLNLSQSALSQHLAWLRRDGLVKTRKEAQTVFYSLSSHAVKEVIGTLYRLYCIEKSEDMRTTSACIDA
ncbi:MAG: ArsR/SmtB family transcription factor [Plesiomonas sp.]|uniref:ArsR/SmtB family transcription factor n=1 Tax=Plesiomonas sp. TaxID=2486279 RepID=UPI003F3024B9